MFYKEVIGYLASDEMQGRLPGSDSEKKAATYISEYFKNKDLRLKKQKFKFVFDNTTYHGTNIIAFKNNKCDTTILISAHYDHLGSGAYKSLTPSTEIHNGADDNASGVALLLYLAEQFEKGSHRYNVLYVAYSGHEPGLFGSQYFSEKMKKRYGTIGLALNMDMVGRLDSSLQLWYTKSDNLEVSLDEMRCNWKESTKNRLVSLDSKWLFEKGIPSITISSGMHIDYHRPSDDEVYINYEGIEIIAADLVNLLGRYLN